MAAQGRKNVHGKTGVRFKAGYTSSKKKNLLRNVATELVVHDKVIVTTSVAGNLVKVADHLVTLAKCGDLHSRRQASAILRPYVVDAANGDIALDKLFNETVKRFEGVNGGYAKMLKVANRKGDNAELRLITWSK
ncbi:MAG: 50S ribosomal protein L17 [Bacilli bacterium]